MKATKYTIKVEIEVLSLDCVPSMLVKAAEEVGSEFTDGHVIASDGDTVSWCVSKEEVTF